MLWLGWCGWFVIAGERQGDEFGISTTACLYLVPLSTFCREVMSFVDGIHEFAAHSAFPLSTVV